MANRIIKESICRSEEIDKLSWFEENLFYRLIVNCDDYGRFDGREKIIKSFCFPLRDIEDSDINNAIQRLSEVGLLTKYEVQGKPIIQLTTWERHQRIRNKVAKYPGAENADAGKTTDRGHLTADRGELQRIAADCGELQQIAADCGELLLESNTIQSNTIQSESENESESKSESEVQSESELESESENESESKKKHKHGEFGKVKLTDEELEKLNAEYGEEKTQEAITWFDAYIAEKGYKSKSHYLAMRRWVFEAVGGNRKRGSPSLWEQTGAFEKGGGSG